jgi:YegS/Rv2252/BmrU family lipid kinase
MVAARTRVHYLIAYAGDLRHVPGTLGKMERSAVDHPPPRRALLLINRRARRGLQGINAAMEVLESAGIEIIEAEMTSRERMDDEIAEDAQNVDLIVIGGGDGSLNSAAPALLKAGRPFGILPLGTANDLARTLEIPPDLEGAARVIAQGRTRRIDLGEVNGIPFFNVASIGFSARLARSLTSEAKRRWGTFGYGLAAARLLAESSPFTVEIEHDGTVEVVRTIQLSVGNGRYYGGGMTVEETARADDGRLDVYSLEVPHWWHLIALAPRLRRGTQRRSKRVRAFPTVELTVRTPRRHEVNADGELVSSTPAHFRIIPKALEAFVPA